MKLSPLSLRLLVSSLLAVSFLGALDNTIVSTALATVAGRLGALEHMGWIVVGYTLAGTVLLPVLGRLGDVVGPRAVFLVSLAVFILASVACGFATSMGWLIASRVIQGMSSAGLQLMPQTIIAHTTSPRERPKYLALIGAAFPVAILIGPVLGGLITDFWGWQWVFWINAPVGIAALALAVVAVPHVVGQPTGRFDIAGALTLSVALLALVLGVSWVSDPSMGGATAVVLVVATVAAAVFAVVELRAEHPLVPFRLFRDRTMAAGTAVSAIVGIGLFSITAYLPTYFQLAYRVSITVSGIVPIATVFGMLAGNLVSGWLASRTGRYRVFPIVGTAVGAAGLAVMAFLPAFLPLWVPTAVMSVVGLGTGCFMSLIVAVVQSAAPRRETGTVTATVNLVRQVGATVTTALIGAVIAAGVASLLPAALNPRTLTPTVVHALDPRLQAQVAGIYHDVFAPVFGGLAIVYAVGLVAALLLPAGRLSDDSSAPPARAEAHSAPRMNARHPYHSLEEETP